MSAPGPYQSVPVAIMSSHIDRFSSDNNGDLAGSDIPLLNGIFPALNGSDIPNCNVIGKNPACSRDGWFPFNALLNW